MSSATPFRYSVLKGTSEHLGCGLPEMDRDRIAIDPPAGLTVSDEGRQIEITRRRKRTSLTPSLFASVFRCMFLFLLTILAAATDPQLMLLLLPFYFAVLFCIYVAAVSALNRTRISISLQYILVQDFPIWFPNNKRIPVMNITKIYLIRRTGKCQEDGLLETVYWMRASLKTGRHITLMESINTEAQALFIKQMAENYLGLEATPVLGEIHGRLT